MTEVFESPRRSLFLWLKFCFKSNLIKNYKNGNFMKTQTFWSNYNIDLRSYGNFCSCFSNDQGYFRKVKGIFTLRFKIRKKDSKIVYQNWDVWIFVVVLLQNFLKTDPLKRNIWAFNTKLVNTCNYNAGKYIFFVCHHINNKLKKK